MQPETALLFWWLNILNKKRYDALIARYGALDDVLSKLSPRLLKELGLKTDSIEKLFVRLEEFDVEKSIERFQKAGIGVLSLEDETYPSLLKESSDPPVFLSYRGDLSVLDHPCIALVGTREMTSYGQRLAEWMTPEFVHAGCTTVSGLAYGIDAVVARTTLAEKGRTVAVLGSGFGAVYPKEHARLAEEIVENGGLLLSEYPFDEGPQQHAFPARNRIVAGVSLATVVIEAPAESGALITARLALEENRDVFACPGNLFDLAMAGCHRLIAEGQAQLLRSPDDVLRTIGVVGRSAPTQSSYAPSSQEEAIVFAALTTLPVTIDDLARKTGKTPGDLGALLTMLELEGGAAKVGSGWIRA